MHDKSKVTKAPSIVGAGLIALDLILDENGRTTFAAGGTCANVLTALSYLGWDAKAVGRLGADYAAEIVLEDLRIFGVDVTFAQLGPRKATPVIVQRMRKDVDGRPYHTFSFSCPSCGRRLPSYQPVPARVLKKQIEEIMSGVKVAFFDRLSRGTLALAARVANAGGIVIFEPSLVQDTGLFKEMLELCHIVKYSHQHLVDYGDVRWGANVIIEIQTLGRGGVRFRHRDIHHRRTIWHHSDAPALEHLVDSCGAGDWFSAGMVHALCRQGKKALLRLSITEINRAVTFAQRLSVWNCGYVGARGGMYSSEGRAILRSIARLQDSFVVPQSRPERDSITAKVCGCFGKDDNPMHELPSLLKSSNVRDRLRRTISTAEPQDQ